ncbi:Universal stress protein family protein [compost metagenome]
MQSLLLATDLSAAAEPALRRAADLAQRYDCPWFILHVVDGERDRAKPAEWLERRVEQLAESSGRAPEIWVEHGDVARQIVACARWAEVDLVVLGAGTVCARLYDLPCDLLIVPPARQEAA